MPFEALGAISLSHQMSNQNILQSLEGVEAQSQCFEIHFFQKYGIKAALLLRYLPNFKPIYFDGLVQEGVTPVR